MTSEDHVAQVRKLAEQARSWEDQPDPYSDEGMAAIRRQLEGHTQSSAVVGDDALEFLAAAHERVNRPLVAVDLRSRNLGKAGVMWVETKTALSAISAAIASLPPREAESDVVEALTAALGNAIEVIEGRVPVDALGSNWEGNDEVPGGVRSWPIRDEYLHFMRVAHEKGRAALNHREGE